MTVRIISIILVVCLQLQGCAAFAVEVKDREGISRIGYSIQVGAFSQVRNAERLTAKLQQKNIEAFYFRKDNGVYAVRFGDFSTYDAARKSARKLVADRVIGEFFIAVPQEVFLKKLPPEIRQGGKRSTVRKPAGDMGPIAARTAERFVGIPYRWGGDNVVEGMDCSGFVRAVYNLCGVNIPRTSREQFSVGDAIPKDELMDGDLVFFGSSAESINHVGIYVGNNRFVHAPRRGDEIKISSLDESYFAKKFVGARRYF
jgi:cell wall-associated NlpC family hydrolase